MVLRRRSPTEVRIVLARDARPRRRWILRPAGAADATGDGARALARETGVGEIAARCLMNRGVSEPAAAQSFLRDGLSALLRPEDLPDVGAAVARIREAVGRRERICVWGDYDVDGVCGTAVLVSFLRRLGADVVPFLPDRRGSGYGFHWPTMERLIGEGVRLFVSVDHGTTAIDAITRAKERGIDVVVADHHEIGPVLPPAVAIINPHRPDSRYGFPFLCGTGVAMKLAWAVAQDLSPGARVSDEMRSFLLEGLALAVLGTVADVVPLRGENRVIVRHGLRVLEAGTRPGIAALLDVARARKPLRAQDVAFKLAPRINAAGRMGSADLALELLLTDDPVRARDIATRLDAENERRRAVERTIAEDARTRALAEFGPSPRGGIAMMSETWHHGVIGIVASRLVDEFRVPVVLVGVHAGVGRGSARTVGGIALHEALAACGTHLVAHGGHAGAAGLTIEPDRFPRFRDAFHDWVAARLDDDARAPVLSLDAEVEPSAVDAAMCADIDRLEPFGEGNPPVVLAMRGVTVAGKPRRMGSANEHVSFFAGRDGAALRCVAFRDAERLAPLLEPGRRIDIAFTPQRNDFRGASEAEAAVVDVRPAE